MDFEPLGIIHALVTTLRVDESPDEGSLRGPIDHVIAGGVYGVFAIVSTGEANAFSYEGRSCITFHKAFDLVTFPNMLKAAMGMLGLCAGPARGHVGGMPKRDLVTLRALSSNVEVLPCCDQTN